MIQYQTIALLSFSLSIAASLLCACRIRNWRHPILLVGLTACGFLPGLLHVENNSLQGEIKADQLKEIEATIEDTGHVSYKLTRGGHAARATTTD